MALLFKALGSISRLKLVFILAVEPAPVAALVRATGMSQSLVSHHLKTLRGVNVVGSMRNRRSSLYYLRDEHVTKILDNAIDHSTCRVKIDVIDA